jgi:hypothetical protein
MSFNGQVCGAGAAGEEVKAYIVALIIEEAPVGQASSKYDVLQWSSGAAAAAAAAGEEATQHMLSHCSVDY